MFTYDVPWSWALRMNMLPISSPRVARSGLPWNQRNTLTWAIVAGKNLHTSIQLIYALTFTFSKLQRKSHGPVFAIGQRIDHVWSLSRRDSARKINLLPILPEYLIAQRNKGTCFECIFVCLKKIKSQPPSLQSFQIVLNNNLVNIIPVRISTQSIKCFTQISTVCESKLFTKQPECPSGGYIKCIWTPTSDHELTLGSRIDTPIFQINTFVSSIHCI